MFRTPLTISSLLKMCMRKLAISFIAIALLICTWSNLLIDISTNANAGTILASSNVIDMEGVKDQIEGKVEKDIGTVERNVGKITGQAKGAFKQAKGKAKQDIGTVKNDLDNAANKVEDTSENLIDSVKDFFD